jgi:protein TonB
MDSNKILSSSLLDLLFENRNKEYGAYDLRKTYNKRIGLALVFTFSIGLLIFAGVVIANSSQDESQDLAVKEEMTIQDIKQEEEKPVEPIPPAPKIDPPRIEMRQFTPPEVVKDEEVKTPPPTNDELKDVKIDVTDQEGIKDLNIAVPPVIDQGKEIIEEKKVIEPEIYEKVEVEASFPGGARAWENFLKRNLDANVPIDNSAPSGRYTVYIQFVVDKDGNVSDLKPITSHGFGMEQEAIRVLRKATKWTPANQNGKSVKAYRKQPITFVVEQE